MWFGDGPGNNDILLCFLGWNDKSKAQMFILTKLEYINRLMLTSKQGYLALQAKYFVIQHFGGWRSVTLSSAEC